jgi:RND family efflux transporter MFP subunit
MKKVFFIVIALTFAGLLGWQIYQKVYGARKGTAHNRRAMAVPVEITPVREMTIRDMGFFTGTLTPRSQFIVAPKIAGQLEKLNVNIGEVVKDNQLIAVLDDDEYVQQVDQARAELEVARAVLEESRSALGIAKRELQRAKALREKKIASESELDETEAQFKVQSAKHKVAQAQIAQREAALKAAQVRLSYTKISVSFEGDNGQWVVGERFVDEGAMLAANASIVSVLDIGSLIAVIHVIERDYPKVQLSQAASVTTDAFPGSTFSGKIVRLAPVLKETSREARVEIEIPNRQSLLKPGMFVRVQIEFERHHNAKVVPQSALVNRKGKQGIFLADTQEMKARFVPVTLGIVNGETAEVVSPSLSGSVVTMGQHLLENGSAVILPPARHSSEMTQSSDSEESKKGGGTPSGGRP